MRTLTLAGTALALSVLAAATAPWIEARADTKVGVTAAVNPQAIGQPPTEPERVLMIGTDTFANEKITTGPAGQVQLLFVDGSSLAVGPDAVVTIDEYVYNSSTKTGKLAISATQGLMRLVGGAISKSNEITVTTPTMTAGIRGGIATIESRPNQPGRAQFLFGQSLRVTAGGVTQTATRPGFQILVVPGQPPQAPVRMTTADTRGAMGQTQARARQASGGAAQGGGEAREDSALGASNVSSATGSNQAPASLTQVGGATTTFNQAFNANTSNLIQQAQGSPSTQINRGAANVQATPFAPTGGDAGTSLFGRFYSDSVYLNGSFNPQNGTALLNPNNNGPITFKLTGSGNNRSITFTLPVGSGNTQQFTLPFNLGTDYSTGPLSLTGGGVANGTVQVAPDGQFFVVFGSFTPPGGQDCGNGGGGCKFGLFGGVPTTSTGLPTSGFSTYQLQTFDNPYPFLGRSNLPAGTSSPLYVAWGPGTNPAQGGPRAVFMQASIWISGTATSQQSGMLGTTGSFFKEAGSTVGAAGGMVGMIRDSAGGLSTRYSSGVASAQIVTPSGNGNAIYGSSGQYIVFVPDQITPTPGGEDTRATGATVEVPYDTLTQNQNSNPNFFLTVGRNPGAVVSADSVGRHTQTLNGYVGGISERRNSQSSFANDPFGSPFGGGPVTTLSFNADTNRFSANFAAVNFQTGGAYNLVFGNPSGSLGAASSFINDLIFAARDARDTSGNPLSTANGSTVAFNRLFMVPNSVAQINLSSFAGPITQCSCEFLQWGWWIGEVQPGSNANLRERFQLATWVAGTLPSTGQISGLSGSATYTGHAVGNVAINGGAGAGGFNYIAAGNFSMSWNFSAHNGSISISNWDRGGPFGANGVTLTGGGSASNSRDFNGSLSGSGLSGPIGGSFFASPSDVAKYVGGNFSFCSGTCTASVYKAAGIFAAQR